jgi:hypothetical protein
MSEHEKILEGWKEINNVNFAMSNVHKCSNECTFVELKITQCPVFGTCIGEGLFPTVQLTRERKRVEVRAKNKCFGQTHHPIMPSVSVFACMFDGTIHHCGGSCDQRVNTYQGDAVCDFTGRVLSETLISKKEKLPAGCVFRETSDYKTEYVRGTIGHADISQYHRYVSSGLKKKDSKTIREELFSAMLMFVTQYITKRIRVTNAERNTSRDEEVRAAINDFIDARRRTRQVNLMALVQLAASMRNRYPVDFTCHMSDTRIRQHSSVVATRIVALMGAVRQFVPGGRQFVDRLPIKNMFFVGMELCRVGFSIKLYTLLRPDPILNLLAKGEDDIAKFWSEHVDHKKVFHNLFKTTNQMLTMIAKGIQMHLVHPEHLRIDEIASSIENVPIDYFDKYRQP